MVAAEGFTEVEGAVSTAEAVAFTRVEAVSTVARLRHLPQVMVLPERPLLHPSVPAEASLRARAMAAFPDRGTRPPAARDLAIPVRERPRVGTASGILLGLRPVGVNHRRDQRPGRSPQVAARM